jgi:hypothetical protein
MQYVSALICAASPFCELSGAQGEATAFRAALIAAVLSRFPAGCAPWSITNTVADPRAAALVSARIGVGICMKLNAAARE